MAAPVNVGRKRKTGAKSKKKGWKKVDVSAVEDFLEDERIQQRTGGLAADKPNETLFFIDGDTKTTGSEPVENKVRKRKHERNNRPLRCFANLRPNPNIKPGRIQHNFQTIATAKLRPADKGIPLVSAAALKQREVAKAEKQKQIVNKWKTKVTFNLWDADVVPTADDSADIHYRMSTKKRRVKVPHHYYEKASSVLPIENPHPGQSYNPTYVDHQDLLRSAYTIEEKKVSKAFRLAKSLRPDCELHVPTEEMEFEGSDSDEDGSPDDTDVTKISLNPPVRREDVKTVKQRQKEMRKKIQTFIHDRHKKKKNMIKDINRLSTIMKDIKADEEKQVKKARGKVQRQMRLKDVPKQLGKLKYTEPDLDLKLSDDLKGSLRLLKPEGHLLKERFHSLQKRNIIETRLRVKREKKKKSKSYERKTHKEIDAR